MQLEPTLCLDRDGTMICVGDTIRTPVLTNADIHGSWAMYTVHKVAGGYTLVYYVSEKGQVLEEGSQFGYLPDVIRGYLIRPSIDGQPQRISEWEII